MDNGALIAQNTVKFTQDYTL